MTRRDAGFAPLVANMVYRLRQARNTSRWLALGLSDDEKTDQIEFLKSL